MCRSFFNSLIAAIFVSFWLALTDAAIENLIRKHALANAYRHEGKADLGAVVSKIIAEQPDIRSKIREVMPAAKVVVQEVNRMSPAEQQLQIEDLFPDILEVQEKRVEERRLPALSNAVEGKVVTRFPPEPNGYPHIGHAKAAVIDETYARMYNGRLILRFDDTNPAKEQLDYYKAIKDGLDWLGVKPDLVKNSSDDMARFYGYAEQMISSGHAYACTCQPDVVKQNRSEGKECACRSLSPDEHLQRWRRMLDAQGYKMNEAFLRVKGDMQSLNTALRDPTLFRIIEAAHPLKDKKYRVWPTYDFAGPIEDSIDGVTHALRTKEYELRDALYFLILKTLGLRLPELIEFSRLELRGTTVSKRKLQPLIRDGLVEGWDDPRLPTLTALRRRGFLPEAVREFVLSLGVSKAESEPDWALLESVNRKMLDPLVRRYFFVPDPVRLEVAGAPEVKAILKLHPEKNFGERVIETRGAFYIPREDAEKLKQGDSLRLLGLYNVEIEHSLPASEEGLLLKGRYAGEDLREGLPKIQWVSADSYREFTVWVTLPLIVDNEFNKESLKIVKGFAEAACGDLKPDDKVQFIRFGFCRIDSPGLAILTHR
ncbi:MAG: glutamate--tRNA ligase [Thaumarchaeota archaeon]|nr:glutamate--tRNA ligase [Nitrososphaerota archaeon]